MLDFVQHFRHRLLVIGKKKNETLHNMNIQNKFYLGNVFFYTISRSFFLQFHEKHSLNCTFLRNCVFI